MTKDNVSILTFDIGGTKINSAIVNIVDTVYEVSVCKKVVTPATQIDLLNYLVTTIQEYSKLYSFQKVGIAIAGQVDTDGKVVINSPNLPLQKNMHLASYLHSITQYSVFLKNDVHSFAMGENYFGKYKHYANTVFIALGTGIGGAIKINGQMYGGANNIAGEFGHMVVYRNGHLCACGRNGCWEKYASGRGLEQLYATSYQQHKKAKELLEDESLWLDTKSHIMAEFCECLATGIANIINIIDPEIVILGGSVIKNITLQNRVIPLIRKQVLDSAKQTPIKFSSLGDKAYLLGVAQYCLSFRD